MSSSQAMTSAEVMGHTASPGGVGLTYHLHMPEQGVPPEVDEVELADRAAWSDLAAGSLRGDTVESLTTTVDGIPVRVLYRSDDPGMVEPELGVPGSSPHTRGGSASAGLVGGWDVRALVQDVGPTAANASVLDELANGSTSVLLDPVAIEMADMSDLDSTLGGVHLEMVPVALVPGPRCVETANWLIDLWDDRGIPVGDRSGDLGVDPLGVASRHGTPAAVGSSIAEVVSRVAGADGVRAVSIDSTPYSDAGLGPSWEVACSLATGVAYLRALEDGGVEVDRALGSMAFTYSASADQFMTIAKFRAARRCWDRVAAVSGSGAPGRAQVQRALTSAAMLTRVGPWVNMLRVTVAGFAAGIAGADSVTLHPFDSAVGRPDAFGRRMARNAQLLLLEESNLARIVDPAGGSWYVEDLTDRLARAAWELFTSIEADGGMAEAIAGGRIAAEAEAAWSAGQERLATGEEVITGVTNFRDPNEVPLVRPGPSPTPEGPLPLRRSASPFEAEAGS
jgi:methylmalonyl-CoA mutase